MEFIFCTILIALTMILMGLMRTFQIKLLFAFLSKGTVTFLVVVAMIVNNSYITTSVKKCNHLKVVPIMQQSLEMEQLLFGLSSLKVGLGPTALCWYAFSVIGLVSIVYFYRWQYLCLQYQPSLVILSWSVIYLLVLKKLMRHFNLQDKS